jgi:hypothetical protein
MPALGEADAGARVDPHQGQRADAERVQRPGERLREGPEREGFILAELQAAPVRSLEQRASSLSQGKEWKGSVHD